MKSTYGPSLEGSTLIEILISMALLSLLWVMALSIWNVLGGVKAPYQRQQTQMLVRQWLYEPLPEKYQDSEMRMLKGRECIRLIESTGEHMLRVKVSCYWQQELLEEEIRWVELP